jgi:hypothetical protein
MNKPMEWYRMKISEMQRRLANKPDINLKLESRVR